MRTNKRRAIPQGKIQEALDRGAATQGRSSPAAARAAPLPPPRPVSPTRRHSVHARVPRRLDRTKPTRHRPAPPSLPRSHAHARSRIGIACSSCCAPSAHPANRRHPSVVGLSRQPSAPAAITISSQGGAAPDRAARAGQPTPVGPPSLARSAGSSRRCRSRLTRRRGRRRLRQYQIA